MEQAEVLPASARAKSLAYQPSVAVCIRYAHSRLWWEPRAKSAGMKKVVLVMDGMDPQLLQRFMDDGKLPNSNVSPRRGTFIR